MVKVDNGKQDMVGSQSALMKRLPNVSKITGKYMGMSFAEMPCFKLVDCIYRDLNAQNWPDEWKGMDADAAVELWRTEPGKAIALMMRFFREIGRPVDMDGKFYFFDLVICKSDSPFPGVYVGRGKIIVSTTYYGVCLAGIGSFNKPIMARRILE